MLTFDQIRFCSKLQQFCCSFYYLGDKTKFDVSRVEDPLQISDQGPSLKASNSVLSSR